MFLNMSLSYQHEKMQLWQNCWWVGALWVFLY